MPQYLQQQMNKESFIRLGRITMLLFALSAAQAACKYEPGLANSHPNPPPTRPYKPCTKEPTLVQTAQPHTTAH